MKKFISKFKNENEDRLNLQLINREFEEDLVEFVLDVFRSLETIRFIKFLRYEVEYDESKINFSKYITSRKKKKKKEKNIKYHYIKPDRVFELTMWFEITVKDQSKIIKKSILLPLKDDNNYLTLKSKKYFLLYQLVDSSTYVSKNGLTLKSLMPVIVRYREKVTILKDLAGNEYPIVGYYMRVFKRNISVLNFYFCKMGFSDTMRYFLMDQITDLIDTEDVPEDAENDKNALYFTINKNFVLKVNKFFFDKYDYVKAMVLMISECFTPKTSKFDIESSIYWIERLGSLYTNTKHKRIDSGESTMLFFERLLDFTTKRKLKVSKINKLSIYSVLRFLIQNFVELRQKNNMDLNTKRLRLNEYIASMLSIKLGDGIARVLAYGNKVSLRQVESNIFKFSGSIVLQALQTSQLLKYDDRVRTCILMSTL